MAVNSTPLHGLQLIDKILPVPWTLTTPRITSISLPVLDPTFSSLGGKPAWFYRSCFLAGCCHGLSSIMASQGANLSSTKALAGILAPRPEEEDFSNIKVVLLDIGQNFLHRHCLPIRSSWPDLSADSRSRKHMHQPAFPPTSTRVIIFMRFVVFSRVFITC